MKNPFNKKKQLPISVKPISNNSISGSINVLPSSLSPIGIIGTSGFTHGVHGPMGQSGWGYASASTFTMMDPEEVMRRRKEELMKEFEQNPELFSEIIVELRQRKIKQIKENAKNVTNITT